MLEDLTFLEGRLARTRDAYEQELLRDVIALRQGQLRRDMGDMARVESAVRLLPARESCVMTALYLKGKPWREVRDESGKNLALSTVAKIRRRALEQMAHGV